MGTEDGSMPDLQEGQATSSIGATAATPAATSQGMFTGGLRFNPPKNFDGKEQSFEEWAYKLRAYLALSNPRFEKMMSEYETHADPVDYDILEADEQIMSAQLQNLLINNNNAMQQIFSNPLVQNET